MELNGLPKPPKKAIIAELWRRGDLTYKFNEVQMQLHEMFESDDREITPILVSRQTGKTYYLLARGSMKCIQKPFTVIKMLQPTLKELKKTVRHIMRKLLEDCPEHLKPEWKEADKIWLFPNGSELQLAGSDLKQYESLRGGAADEWYVDEAGFCDDLHDAVFSVLVPTTITTNGRGFLASTPSKLTAHPFIQEFVNPAKIAGKLKVFTAYDNPMMTPERLKRIISSYPRGEQNPEFRREYLCEIIQDSESTVIAEFNDDIRKECIKDVIKPPFFDIYQSMDIGFKHLTVVLFGYYNFLEAKLVICDELVLFGPAVRSDNLAKLIREKEEENFKDDYDEILPVYLRVADNNNPILLNDLSYMHDINFFPTAKDDKEAQINHLKMMIANKQVIISPKCKHLIYHLGSATWDKNRKKFNELPDLIDDNIYGGHADALDALIYLVRNLVKDHNPYPSNWGQKDIENYFVNKTKVPNSDKLTNIIKKIMNLNLK